MAAVGVDAVARRARVCSACSGPLSTPRRNRSSVCRVVAVRREVPGDVGGAGGDRSTGDENVSVCQPEAVSLVNVPEARSVPLDVPEAADVRAGVRGRFVEPDPGDGAALTSAVNLTPSSTAWCRRSRWSTAWRSRRSCPPASPRSRLSRADLGPLPLVAVDRERVGRPVGQAGHVRGGRRATRLHRRAWPSSRRTGSPCTT